MSFEGARFRSYDSPRALSYTVSLSFPPPLYRCISPLSYLSFTHSLTPFLSLTPRLPVALSLGCFKARCSCAARMRRETGGRTAAKGRGNQMTCSFRVAHSLHNRLTFSPTPLPIFLLHTSIFHILPFLPHFIFHSQDLARIIHPKHTHIHKLTLSTSPPACHVMQAT